jgi:hypothetical protein
MLMILYCQSPYKTQAKKRPIKTPTQQPKRVCIATFKPTTFIRLEQCCSDNDCSAGCADNRQPNVDLTTHNIRSVDFEFRDL